MRCIFLIGLLALTTALHAPALGTIREVPSDYPTIQQGLDAAAPGDTVRVAPGTYTGSGNRALDFAGRDLVLLSAAGATGTVIDCGLSARALHIHSGETRAAIVEGFTFRNGAVSNAYGGALFCDGSSPTIRDCVVEASRHSGSNGAGGGICFRNSGALMERCVIRNCATTGFGGGIACRGTLSPTISECTAIGNSALSGGGGIDCGGIGAPRILDCDVAGNSAAGAGGGILLGGAAGVERCRITGNYAGGGGGGVYCAAGGSVAILGCTVAGNRAGGDGGGLGAFGAVAMERSILWGNCCAGVGDQGIAGDGGRVTIACSETVPSEVAEAGGEVVFLGENIVLDPLFCGPLPCESAPSTEGDYRIDRASPAMPGGNPCGIWIGAEGVGCPAAAVVETGAPAVDRLLHGVFPNPCPGRISCAVHLPARSRVVVEIFDPRGRSLGVLHDGELPVGVSLLDLESGGFHRSLPAGAYILRLKADGVGADSRSVVLVH